MTDNVVSFPDGHVEDSAGTQGLPEQIIATELPQLNQALRDVFVSLRAAKELRGRDCAAAALGAVCRFVMEFQAAADEALHVPLLDLHHGLRDLDQNTVAEILRPSKKNGRSILSHQRAVLIAVAVGAAYRLEMTGMSRAAADAAVVHRLRWLPLRTTQDRITGITARTLRGWRERIDAAQPLLRGLPDLVFTLTPEEVQWANIAANVAGMVSAKWQSTLHSHPQPRARRFVLDALANAISGFVT
jgi:hypothetical protein